MADAPFPSKPPRSVDDDRVPNAVRVAAAGTGSVHAGAGETGGARSAHVAGDTAGNGPNVTWRSVGLGLLGAAFLSLLAPYNDWVLNNTLLIGSFLPVSVLMMVLGVVLVLNPLLARFAATSLIRPGEIGVSLAMVLCAATIPSSGFLRYLPAGLVGSIYQSRGNADSRRAMEAATPADWLFPDLGGKTIAERMGSPVVEQYIGRASVENRDFGSLVSAVPWRAWVRPAVAWGAFGAAMWTAILSASVIVRRQWQTTERLLFPLATVWLSLIEPPAAGRRVNALLSNRAFWITAGSVFAVHLLAGLSKYDPEHFPAIPLSFDLTQVFSERPWSAMDLQTKMATLYMSIVGICFFLQTKVSFSLWFFFAMYQFVRMFYGQYETEMSAGARTDQTIGAIVPFVAWVVYAGRDHWRMVGRQMIGRRRPADPNDPLMPYATAGWGLIAGTGGMVIWLWLAGMTLGGAVLLVGMLLTAYLVLARVVAETGLMYMEVGMPLHRPWVYLANDLGPLSTTPAFTDVYFTTWFWQLFGHDTREALPPLATTAVVVADAHRDGPSDVNRPGDRVNAFAGGFGKRYSLAGAIALAMLVSYGLSWTSNLYVEYAHATTLSKPPTAPINPWGVQGSVQYMLMGPATDFLPPRTGPTEPHSRLLHLGIGTAVMTLLSGLRIAWPWWPLQPVGYLLMYAWLIKIIWFSVFLGWLLKSIATRFGGVDLYRKMIPVMIGLIIGEAFAAAFWLTTSIILGLAGHDFYSIQVLPP